MTSTNDDEPQIVLNWLSHLRWLAVVGQLTAVLVAVYFLKLQLHVAPVASVIALTAFSNLLLLLPRWRRTAPRWVVPLVVLLDVVLLTVVLYFTGGTQNPFALLFIVHVAIAVVLLSTAWTWAVVVASAAGYAVLTFYHLSLMPDRQPLPLNYLRAGQWVALVLTAVLIAYFIGRLQRAIRQRDLELTAVKRHAEQSARFAAVTALAAGAAHELGSPLGTIAIVAKELELAAANVDTDIVDDVRLIRTEVDRCRAILDRLRLEVGDDLRYVAGQMTGHDFIHNAIADLTQDRKARVKPLIHPSAQTFFLASRAVLRAVGVLLRNGFEASQPEQDVELRLRCEPGKLIIQVQDHGSGMPPDVLKRAGEPFFTTKELGRGMGMGLFLVKLVAENNGGVLELSSEPGKGTLAQLILPDSPPSARLAKAV